MNGSLHSSPNVVDIKLKRGPAGLGFNIVGGVDQQYVVNDTGIYVSKIKEDGAAALDGRLQEGDKILAINGVELEDRTHKHAVELFRTAGEEVELRVLKKVIFASGVSAIKHIRNRMRIMFVTSVNYVLSPHHMNGPTGSQPEHESPVTTLGKLLALAGAAAVFAFLYIRLRKHL